MFDDYDDGDDFPDVRDFPRDCLNCISYKRFSKPSQRKGNSTVRQSDLEAAYVVRFGFNLLQSFFDEGVSALTGENADIGALSRLLEMVRREDIRRGTYLIIESFDRLTRQKVRHALRLLLDLIDAGIIIHTLADGQVYWDKALDFDPTKIIVSITVMMRAHDESRMKKRRSLDNVRRSRKAAIEHGTPFIGRTPAWLDVVVRDGKRVSYKENKVAGIVRQICDWAAQGWPINEITLRLNTNKTPTLMGRGKWFAGGVARLLQSEAVEGWWTPHRYIREPGKRRQRVQAADAIRIYPVIVEAATVRLARDNIENRRLRGKGQHSITFANLLKGICDCGVCGGKVYHDDHGHDRHAYLTCHAEQVQRAEWPL